jgi:hypothetical protein
VELAEGVMDRRGRLVFVHRATQRQRDLSSLRRRHGRQALWERLAERAARRTVG